VVRGCGGDRGGVRLGDQEGLSWASLGLDPYPLIRTLAEPGLPPIIPRPVVRVRTLAGDSVMSKSSGRKEVTSARAATAASKVLSNPRSTAAQKTAAASALTQRPGSATRKK